MDFSSVIEIGPLRTSLVEIIAVCFGLLSVWYMRKESILAYPTGAINVLIYVYICFSAKLYAYAGINVFYFLMGLYGWYSWSRKGSDQEKLQISHCLKWEWFLYPALIIVFFFLLRILLLHVTDSVVPSWDAITTAIYIIAMWLLARKKIEHWLLWIAGDVISIGLFGYLNLWFSSFQYFVFTIMAVFGYVEWKRKMGLLNNSSNSDK
jgi:nicotinamide mononucleotide transporter